jgi:hypothetical protein
MSFQIIPYTTDTLNAYPNLPEVEFFNGTVAPADFIAHAQTLGLTGAQVAALIAIAYWESGRLTEVTEGTNPFNFQADESQWSHAQNVVYTTVFVDSTGDKRRFVVFAEWQDSSVSMAYYIVDRGIFIGAPANSDWDSLPVIDATDLYRRYNRAWILGDASAVSSTSEASGFAEVYTDVLEAISGTQPAAQPVAPVAEETPPTPAPLKVNGDYYEYGDSGDDVKTIQLRLTQLGLFTDTPTGNYYSHTKTAVGNFQLSNGLPVTGNCDLATLQALGLV